MLSTHVRLLLRLLMLAMMARSLSDPAPAQRWARALNSCLNLILLVFQPLSLQLSLGSSGPAHAETVNAPPQPAQPQTVKPAAAQLAKTVAPLPAAAPGRAHAL